MASALIAVMLALAPGRHAMGAEPPRLVPLSKDAARTIAARYFAEKIAVEGSVGEPVLHGDYWAFPAKFGYAGAVAPDPILVHRTSGEVSWAGLSGHEAFMERIRTGKGR